ncbi:hypothetical protein EDB84DRAFT_1469985 [Lactarius hengduanensis]|nr:hypothetical protein EDB84DRAFT_1511276 [Lactarius hengduanensis]KAH9044880.1 hypothetical protein EDB84DRAFT_1469985 [Lactarius hengduanensis]
MRLACIRLVTATGIVTSTNGEGDSVCQNYGRHTIDNVMPVAAPRDFDLSFEDWNIHHLHHCLASSRTIWWALWTITWNSPI